LNPTKAKHLLPAIAIRHNEDVALLEHLHNFYWDRIRETLTTTAESTVKVLNLGEFERKHWCLERRHKKALAFWEKVKDSGRKADKHEILMDIKLLEAMKEFRDAEANRKRMKNHTRHEYNQNLEKPEPNH
jgi:hypothetical protein